MKPLFHAFWSTLLVSTTAFALTRTVTIEGPVEVVASSTAPNSIVYWIEDPQQHVKYRVLLPDQEQVRFASIIEKAPATVIRFDGTVSDKEAEPVLNVREWNTVTKTTTTTDRFGNTKTTEETTTYEE